MALPTPFVRSRPEGRAGPHWGYPSDGSARSGRCPAVDRVRVGRRPRHAHGPGHGRVRPVHRRGRLRVAGHEILRHAGGGAEVRLQLPVLEIPGETPPQSLGSDRGFRQDLGQYRDAHGYGHEEPGPQAAPVGAVAGSPAPSTAGARDRTSAWCGFVCHRVPQGLLDVVGVPTRPIPNRPVRGLGGLRAWRSALRPGGPPRQRLRGGYLLPAPGGRSNDVPGRSRAVTKRLERGTNRSAARRRRPHGPDWGPSGGS